MSGLVNKLRRNEEGQAMVLVALMLVVLMGFTAFAVDVGMTRAAKTKMQSAADAAALAGAQELPGAKNAKDKAVAYGAANGADDIAVTTPYEGDPEKLKVVCAKNVPYSFARVLGFTDVDVSARAVAKITAEWAGEALPFINLDDDYQVTDQIVTWADIAPGDFERMWKESYRVVDKDDPARTHFIVDYLNGIMIQKGVDASDKNALKNIFNQGNPAVVYLFSLSSEVIQSGKYSDDVLKNKMVIPLEDMVLLQVTFDQYQHKHLSFTVLNVYDINNGVLPTEHLHSGGNPSLTE